MTIVKEPKWLTLLSQYLEIYIDPAHVIAMSTANGNIDIKLHIPPMGEVQPIDKPSYYTYRAHCGPSLNFPDQRIIECEISPIDNYFNPNAINCVHPIKE